MNPVLFRIGDAALYAYPFLLSCAFFVAILAWRPEARRYDIDFETIIDMSLGAFVGGLLGARALYLVTRWPLVVSGELRPWALWEGGLVFYGGAIAGAAILARNLRKKNIPIVTGFGTLTPALAWGHAVGRLGCFLNGCCYGDRCDLPWGVTFSNPLAAARPLGVPLHPTQLYEVFGLLLLGWAARRRLRAQSPRHTLKLYVLGYAVLRLVVEFFRGDPERGVWGPLSTSQWISIGLIFLVVLLDSRRARGHNTAP